MISEDPIKWMDGSMNMIVNTMIKIRQKEDLRKLNLNQWMSRQWPTRNENGLELLNNDRKTATYKKNIFLTLKIVNILQVQLTLDKPCDCN